MKKWIITTGAVQCTIPDYLNLKGYIQSTKREFVSLKLGLILNLSLIHYSFVSQTGFELHIYIYTNKLFDFNIYKYEQTICL